MALDAQVLRDLTCIEQATVYACAVEEEGALLDDRVLWIAANLR